MSSAREATRLRLLTVARRLFEERGPHSVGMDEIARAAGVSRQTAYLHFGSKSGMLLALVAHVDAGRDVNQRVEELWTLPDAATALHAVAGLAAATNPEVHRIAMVFDAARRWDPAFEQAWQDRTAHRLDRYRRLARWLHRDGVLGRGWTVETATTLLWSLTSVEVYDQLTGERGLSTSDYEALLGAALRATLTAPFTGPAEG